MTELTEIEQECCNAIVKGGQEIFSAHLVDFGEGNISMRHPTAPEMFITPTRNDYVSLPAEDVVHLSFEGSQLSAGRKPSSEYRLHVALYQAHPKANCVIHTHSPYACMLGAVQQKIPILLEEMLLFLGGEIEVAPFTPAGTDQIGPNAVRAMGDTNGVLMTDHGALVCGRTMEAAVKNAKLVEKTAFIYWGASQLGDVHTVPKDTWMRFLEFFHQEFSTL